MLVKVNVVYIFMMHVLFCSDQTQAMLQRLDQFKRNALFDGKKCKNSDVAFQGTPLSLGICASRCRITAGCSGFMYNRMKSSCVGCRGGYTNETTLDTEVDTQYFEDDWLNYNGTFFKLSIFKANFSNAVEYCKSTGAFDTAEKTQFFMKSFGTGIAGFWIGLAYDGHKGTYTWISDGSEPKYTYWLRNTQGHKIGWECVRTIMLHNYKWNNVPCSTTRLVLCERQW